MAQSYDKYELDNDNGKAFRLALNDILEASATQNSGPNSPNTSNTSYPYQVWVDETNDIVKIRDAATAGSWYSLYSVDSDGKPTGAVSYGSYTIATNDTAGTGGTTAITVDTSQKVGIGLTSPTTVLDVDYSHTNTSISSPANAALRLQNTNATANNYFTALAFTTSTTGVGTDSMIASFSESAGNSALAFYTDESNGMSERVRIDSAGRLLVGGATSTYANAKVQIAGPVGYSYFSLLNTTASDSDGHRYSYINFRGRQSGGEESNLARVGAVHDGPNDDEKGKLEFWTNDGNDGNSGQRRMVIDSNGDVYMGQGKGLEWRFGTTSTLRGKIVVESTDTFYFYQGSTAIERFSFNTSGNFYFNPTGVAGRLFLNTTNANRSFGETSTGSASSTVYIGNAAIQVSSDERIKENIQDTQLDALAAVKQISVKDFTWNDPKDTSHNNRNARGTWTGVIAQELVEILPFVVNAPRNEDTLEIDHDSEEIWMLDQSQLCPVLIKAMQQQQAMIETLQAKVAALESA